MLRELDHRKTGQGLVILVLSASILVGSLAMAIGLGNLYLQRHRAQVVADAGAVAGTLVLASGGSDAEVQAAVRNYTVAEDQMQVFRAFYVPSGDEVGAGFQPSDARGIRVSAQVTSPTLLARVLGFDSAVLT